MKNLLPGGLLSVSVLVSYYLICSHNARAHDWGCQVILCLSNPEGPTQYEECRPPIQKLWRHLAKWRSFPTYSGVGFQSSRLGYEPYYCDAGCRLSGSYCPYGEQSACLSDTLQPVNPSRSSSGCDNGGVDSGPVLSAHWQRQDSVRQCMGYPIKRPDVRSQPRHIDVTIDGIGKQRVWY